MPRKRVILDTAIDYAGATSANPVVVASFNFTTQVPFGPWPSTKASASLEVRVAFGVTTSVDLYTEVWELVINWQENGEMGIDRQEIQSPTVSSGKVAFSAVSNTTLEVSVDFDGQSFVGTVELQGVLAAQTP